MRALQLDRPGGIDALTLRDIEAPTAGPGNATNLKANEEWGDVLKAPLYLE